jgi:hypothetical protein
MVVKEGMILAGLGIVIGIACVLALSHLLIALLCGVKLKEAAASCRCICFGKMSKLHASFFAGIA